jgi:flagellar export protein FliJ
VSRLPVLVRLHRRRLDEARLNLVRIEAERAALQAREAELEETMVVERRAARSSFDAARTYPSFARRMRVAFDALARGIAEADVAVDQASDQMTARFRELKTYELALEAEIERARADEARLERNELDEIAANRARRDAPNARR